MNRRGAFVLWYRKSQIVTFVDTWYEGDDLAAQPASSLPSSVHSVKEKHIKALDGIRGLAVLSVLFFHFGDLSHSHSVLLRLVGSVKDAGWIGVDIFFALSGFLITGILFDTRHRPRAARNFYARRALRLFPLFYGIWIVIAVYLWLAHLPWHGAYWLYLLYAGNFVAAHYGTAGILGIAHFWSLAVEEQYYLIWPSVVWKIKSFRTISAVLAGAIVVSFLLRILLIHKGVNPYIAYYLLPTHIDGIALGSFVALAMRHSLEPTLQKVSSLALPLSIVAICAIGVSQHGFKLGNPIVQLFGYPLLGIFACSLIVLSLKSSSIISRSMTNPVLRFYGKYSYGLYIYNYFLHDTFRTRIYSPLSTILHNQMLLNLVYVAICYLLLTALSVASFHLYESPFLRLKRKFEVPRGGDSAAAPQVQKSLPRSPAISISSAEAEDA